MVGYGGFGGSAGGRSQFVKREKSADAEGGAGGNMASKFAGKALRSEMAKADGQLQSDFESVLKGEAIYLPNFHCAKRDFSLLAGLAKDMEEQELAMDDLKMPDDLEGDDDDEEEGEDEMSENANDGDGDVDQVFQDANEHGEMDILKELKR